MQKHQRSGKAEALGFAISVFIIAALNKFLM